MIGVIDLDTEGTLPLNFTAVNMVCTERQLDWQLSEPTILLTHQPNPFADITYGSSAT